MNVGNRVRLRVAAASAPVGAEGRVVGRYGRNGRTEVAVALDGMFVFVDEEDLELVPRADDVRPPSRRVRRRS